jgi:alkaline phosphatase
VKVRLFVLRVEELVASILRREHARWTTFLGTCSFINFFTDQKTSMRNKRLTEISFLRRNLLGSIGTGAMFLAGMTYAGAQEKERPVRPEPQEVQIPEGLDDLAAKQHVAIQSMVCPWGYWGVRPESYSSWTNHSNRLIPVYVFGSNLSPYIGSNSIYRDSQRLKELYGQVPVNTLNPNATYADQTDVYRLQRSAIESGSKKYVFLVVFDGMDWQTTQAAAIYRNRSVAYTQGRGTGLVFQDYNRCETDFGFFVTSSLGEEVDTDVDAQIDKKESKKFGGYDARLGGSAPWESFADPQYLIGRNQQSPHVVTDSSSSASSMTAGVKILNGAINVKPDRTHVETIAQWAQREKGFAVGTVTSVPICHATPAAAYAVNVSRDDYQDLSRDMLGLPSVTHKSKPYPGLDVVLGAGFGETTKSNAGQGENFIPGNRYLADPDRDAVDVTKGDSQAKYVVAQRTSGKRGQEVLWQAARQAIEGKHRLLGFFGAKNGHLPFQTANGDYKPVATVRGIEEYTPEDLSENPKLNELTEAAIEVLASRSDRFWLLVEAGDVDWANHANDIDSSIGAVFSGEQAVGSIFQWIEKHQAWEDSLVIVTADHGHYFNLVDTEAIIPSNR